MTAILAAPALALLDALVDLVASDPAVLAQARTVADCDRDDTIAQHLGALLATLHTDPRAADRRELLERARGWHARLVEHLARRRKFVLEAHAMPAELHARYGVETTADCILDDPFCQTLAATPEAEIERERQQAEAEERLRAELFHGDRELERQAWKAGTHPLHPSRRPTAA